MAILKKFFLCSFKTTTHKVLSCQYTKARIPQNISYRFSWFYFIVNIMIKRMRKKKQSENNIKRKNLYVFRVFDLLQAIISNNNNNNSTKFYSTMLHTTAVSHEEFHNKNWIKKKWFLNWAASQIYLCLWCHCNFFTPKINSIHALMLYK